jgi:hypothetical protein
MKSLFKSKVLKRIAMALAVVLAILVTFWSAPTTYDVNAETETVHVQIGTSPIVWGLSDVTMYRDFDQHSERLTGSFSLSKGTDVVVERIASGPLRVRCKSSDGSVGDLWSQGSQQKLGRRVSFVVPDIEKRAKSGETLLFPVSGDIELGQGLTFDTTTAVAILQSGTVRVLGRSLLGPTLFEAGTYPLELGDDLRIEPSLSPSVGVLVAGDHPGLRVSIRGNGKSAMVTRFGSSGYEIRTSLYSRLKNDAALQILWVASLAFVGFARSFWKQESA